MCVCVCAVPRQVGRICAARQDDSGQDQASGIRTFSTRITRMLYAYRLEWCADRECTCVFVSAGLEEGRVDIARSVVLARRHSDIHGRR